MGFVQEVKSVIDGVGHAVGSVWTYTKNTVSKIANAIGTSTKTVYSDAKNAVTSVYQTSKQFSQTIVNDVNSLANKGVDTVSSLGHSALNTLEIPLILLGAGVLAFMLGAGKNSSANVSYSR